ncbi:hypothetical protein PS2_194 [Serratia phage PS2]|uniref:Uncharacterized protein n=1 Tax=Serratia phage PS2 TaxID=1481112 RepID=A0A023W6H8_9CAUD|nr:hypothetical protein FF83_gp221 [Serratia phage PS2]AHY25436.1 hypothetical protein PS2_194 [Serratia phage PS2]
MITANAVKVFTPNTYVLNLDFFWGDGDICTGYRKILDPKCFDINQIREFLIEAKEVTEEQPEDLPEWFTDKWPHIYTLLKSDEDIWWTLERADIWYVDEVGTPWSLEKI